MAATWCVLHKRHCYHIINSMVVADGVAPICARPSVTTLMMLTGRCMSGVPRYNQRLSVSPVKGLKKRFKCQNCIFNVVIPCMNKKNPSNRHVVDHHGVWKELNFKTLSTELFTNIYSDKVNIQAINLLWYIKISMLHMHAKGISSVKVHLHNASLALPMDRQIWLIIYIYIAIHCHYL